MKRYRCPHCGKKAFSGFNYFWLKHIRDSRFFAGRKVNYFVNTLSCPHCGNRCAIDTPFGKNSDRSSIFFIIELLLVVAAFIIYRFYKAASFIPLIIMLIMFIFWILSERQEVLVGCLPDLSAPISQRRTHARIILNKDKRIVSRMVYAIRFDVECTDKKFNEAFNNRLVPVEIRKVLPEPNVYDVFFFNYECIPEDLLTEGAHFQLEGNNGKLIDQGVVTKLYEINNEEEEKL
jgi:hypothetical protein